ncbi:hypothetical protein CV_3105 [Chromobacterium violaceum ATCC 12472]|uniref:Uncharacterized protein n=1 Tax=Chromobacterium violaceum (strain ATCC 12472 / DSM 30191 / JCM 1249 / CCUG 213 / NBRC 12614 / NCIMB 9131 / NCTC 9757 / MK) TaxID=243365 RepID=Q7NTF2_CHRVO|nr:hypothetical protein CV_3105 [Chromobacterium violaceum ATCC 12472]
MSKLNKYVSICCLMNFNKAINGETMSKIEKKGPRLWALQKDRLDLSLLEPKKFRHQPDSI